jgi:hypothetical protein
MRIKELICYFFFSIVWRILWRARLGCAYIMIDYINDNKINGNLTFKDFKL